MKEAALLNRLKALQAEYALGCLKSPGDKSEYEFGLRVGTVAGIELAIDTILNALRDEREDKDSL